MKRALAERAKQSLPNGVSFPPKIETSMSRTAGGSSGSNVMMVDSSAPVVALSSLSSSPSPDAPPHKVPRLELGPSPTETQSSSLLELTKKEGGSNQSPSLPTPQTHAPPSQSQQQQQQPPGAKSTHRSKRKSMDATTTEEEHDQASAFYLKHQNRALATELKSLQFQVQQLESERETRREHILQACQALNALQATWTGLEAIVLGTRSDSVILSTNEENTPSTGDSKRNHHHPPSTGTGQAVEWTTVLSEALASLGRNMSAGSPPPEEQAQLISSNIASRASVLQDCLVKLLLQQQNLPQQFFDAVAHERDIIQLQCQVQQLQTQVTELAAARDDLAARERRVRRNVYRLSTGILTAEHVIQAVQSDEAESEIIAEVSRDAVAAAAKFQANNNNNSLISAEQGDASGNNNNNAESTAKVEMLNNEIESLKQQISNREKAIEGLHAEIKEKELRINHLLVRQQTEEDRKLLESLEATQQKLGISEKRVEELESKLVETREKWSEALANEKALTETIEEMQSKFTKRWAEVTDLERDAEHSIKEDHAHSDSAQIVASQTIIELRHKLSQALENVRQAESTRSILNDTLEMVEPLKAKLEEMKAKYSALQQQMRKDAARPATGEVEAGNTAPKEKDGNLKEKDGTAKEGTTTASDRSSADGVKLEKLHRDYRRARKELAAVVASKDATKAKLERSEKEREALVETNARLLAQIKEKDEMNAKSLSTILHLKSMTEQLVLERENLEQEAKSASQLSLSARLATNAKERISEEILNAKIELEERLASLEEEHANVKAEVRRISHEWSESSARTTLLQKDLSNALKRADELVGEVQQKKDEIRLLLDSVDKANREARDATEQLESFKKSTGNAGLSSFTAEQLTTQIDVLKQRLACPVCHYRDKECIIMRCRHMHCKECVEERITNRSRKCPTCNNKFSEKDVEDIWLN